MTRRALALALCAVLVACGEKPEQAVPAQSASPAQAAATPAPVASVEVPQGRFAPRDDCAADSRAAAFQAELKRVVSARDLDRLLAMTDPQVELDFGGGAGHDELRQRLASTDYDLWAELDRIMPLGCAIDQRGNVVMPWYFAQDTGGDPFETMLVTGNAIAVRAEASATSRQLGAVSWDIVDLVVDENGAAQGWAPDSGWVKVRTRDEPVVTGFIAQSDLRSVIDYRLVADKTDADLRISAFLAGD